MYIEKQNRIHVSQSIRGIQLRLGLQNTANKNYFEATENTVKRNKIDAILYIAQLPKQLRYNTEVKQLIEVSKSNQST